MIFWGLSLGVVQCISPADFVSHAAASQTTRIPFAESQVMITVWTSKEFCVGFLGLGPGISARTSNLQLDLAFICWGPLPEMMLSLRFLTSKFRAQSLNEVQPFDFETACTPCKTTAEEIENTDSEEENQEVEQLFRERRMCSVTMGQVPSTQQNHIMPLATKPRPLEDNSSENILLSTPSSERHSSEEELACMDRQMPEKRKWSQMNQWNNRNNSDVSSSSDEEVRDLFTKTSSPLQFSTSPPKHLCKLSPKRIDSKPHFMANVVSPSFSAVDYSSPRKRHRHSHHDSHGQSGRRIDFEKMQQKMFTKRHMLHGHGLKSAKLVRIKTIALNNNRVPPRLLSDLNICSFRSICNINPMTPVEDPSLTAYWCSLTDRWKR